MSAPNSAMAIHRLVLIVDRFSLHCNSIQSPVSIVHLRVILTYLIPLLRVYINYSISNAVQFQLAQQCIQISTRINSSSVHTYIFVCSTLRVILQGFVDPKCNTKFNQNKRNPFHKISTRWYQRPVHNDKKCRSRGQYTAARTRTFTREKISEVRPNFNERDLDLNSILIVYVIKRSN